MNESNAYSALVYAVRFSALGHLGGRLALFLAAMCLPSLLVAAWFAEYQYLPSLTAVMTTLLLCARLCWKLPEPHRVFVSEGFVLTSMTFLLTPLIMSVALWPAPLSFPDLLLETTSALTTTGLSTVAHPESADKTLLFTRAWMQWYGGLGIVVLSVALLMQRSLAIYQLLDIPEGQGFVSTVTVYARRILRLYLVMSALAILVCWVALGDVFAALLHGFAAISTGGFSSFGSSLTPLSFPAQLAIMLCGLAGAISFALYLQLWRHSWYQVLHNQELRFFMGLLLALCMLLALVHWYHGSSLGSALENAIIMGMSALSTTGFSSEDPAQMSAAWLLLVIVAMFIGGCLGSTAGGFKIFRLLVVLQVLLTYFRRAAAAPHAVIEPRIQGQRLTQDQVQLAMLTGSLLVALTISSWFAFLLYDYAPLPALFEVVSAVGTVGLSAGITSTELPLPLKFVLCLDMIAGRVEVLALICVLYPSTWFGHRNQNL